MLLVVFAAVYVPLSAKRERDLAVEKDLAVARANQAKLDFVSGKVFVGRDGKKEAEADLSRSAPKLYLYGKTGADLDERSAVFKQRFGVELVSLAGCIVSEALVTFADAYNEVIEAHIAKKFGASAFEDADREAMRMWKERANQPPEPTALSVTPRADARVAPAGTVAHL
jgi:hypothetical protein